MQVYKILSTLVFALALALSIPAAYALSIRPIKKARDVLFFFISTKFLPIVAGILPLWIIARELGIPAVVGLNDVTADADNPLDKIFLGIHRVFEHDDIALPGGFQRQDDVAQVGQLDAVNEFVHQYVVTHQ